MIGFFSVSVFEVRMSKRASGDNNANSTTGQYLANECCNIFLALANCDDEEWAAIPRISPISLWDMSCMTDILNTLP